MKSFLIRACFVWLLIIVAETISGTIRTILVVPLAGDFHARQIGVFIGAVLILIIAFFSVRWIAADSGGALLIVGMFWVFLTVLFEIVLGRLILGLSWQRIFSDYDISNGGLLGLGMLVLLFAPMIAAKTRGLTTNHVKG